MGWVETSGFSIPLTKRTELMADELGHLFSRQGKLQGPG